MSERFSYTALRAPEATRLLEILPASDLNDPVHIKLREISLLPFINGTKQAERVRYYALSYVWGAREASIPIFCDDKRFLVTPNCDLALRYLRTTSCATSLWVDAISIDQSSSTEKSQQVARMGKIYQWAHMVVVWLGAEDALTHIAFRYLRRLSIQQSSKDKSNGLLTRIMYKGWARIISKKDDEHRLGDPQKGFLRDLLCSAYFQRFWTLQELAMARSAMVVSGTQPLTWATFASGADIFLSGSGDTYSGYVGPNGTDNIAGFFGHFISWGMLAPWINTQGKPQLNHEQRLLHIRFLITASHSHQTSNPKDRIFALYNMFQVVGVELPKPDYDKSQATILREATIMIIRQTGTLIIFEFFPSKELPQSPSWVHDFLSPDGREGYELWSACKDSRVALNIIPHDCITLQLKGIQFDFISRITSSVVRQTDALLDESLSESTRISIIACSFRSWIEAVQCYTNNVHPRTSEDTLTAFYQTVVNHPSNWGYPLEELREVFNALYNATAALNPQSKLADPSLQKHEYGTDLWSKVLSMPHSPSLPVLSGILRVFWQFYESKRFFVTSEGYFGTGPGKIEENDVAFLLAGATMPIILRPSGGSFHLVGPVYIHGIMNGEAWPNDPINELSTFLIS